MKRSLRYELLSGFSKENKMLNRFVTGCGISAAYFLVMLLVKS